MDRTIRSKLCKVQQRLVESQLHGGEGGSDSKSTRSRIWNTVGGGEEVADPHTEIASNDFERTGKALVNRKMRKSSPPAI